MIYFQSCVLIRQTGMRTEIKNGNVITHDGKWQKAGESAYLSCPKCGLVGWLQGTHSIDAAGKVDPSVVCGCGWHKFVTLLGWNDGIGSVGSGAGAGAE